MGTVICGNFICYIQNSTILNQLDACYILVWLV